jgi:CRP-like cAMP-binding protein
MAAPPIVDKLLRYMTLGDREIALLEAVARERRTVAPGGVLLDPKETYDAAYLIQDGWALRFRLMPDQSRQVLNFLLPGDAFGLGTLVLSRPDHSVSAITQVTVSPIAPEALLGLMRDHPRLGAAFLWSAAQEEAVLREHIVSIGRRSAYERVAHLLLELLHRLELVGLTVDESYVMPLSQPLLADALGLSTVHVNRTLRRLQADGLIAVRSRRLSILNYEALKRAADFHRAFLHLPTETHAAAPLIQA